MSGAHATLVAVPGLAVEPLHPGGFFPPDPDPGAEPHRDAVRAAVEAGLGGDFAGALAALDAAPAAPSDAAEAAALANRSAALLGLMRLDEAERTAARALRVARRTRDGAVEAVGAFALALAHLARGRRGDARARLGDAVRGFAKGGDVPRQVQCHHLLGEIAYDGEDPIRAGAHYRDALALARDAGMDAAVELLMLRFEHR